MYYPCIVHIYIAHVPDVESVAPQYLVQPCSSTKGKISLGLCGRFTLAELLSVTVSIGVRESCTLIIVYDCRFVLLEVDRAITPSSPGGLCVGADRPLGPDGLHGNGSLCCLHRLRQVLIYISTTTLIYIWSTNTINWLDNNLSFDPYLLHSANFDPYPLQTANFDPLRLSSADF